MNIAPNQLTANNYVWMDQLDHKEIIPFVRTYLKKPTPIAILYKSCNIVMAAFIGFWFWRNYDAATLGIDMAFGHLAYGFSIAFGLIPLHEYIHVLAYKWQGAKHTSYDVVWKKFYFLAVADKFVANRKEFTIVALAPFVVISATLIVLLFFVSTKWSFTILGVLLTHTAFSSGDFGIMSYFDYHKDKDIVTYDDKEMRISYFYGKPL